MGALSNKKELKIFHNKKVGGLTIDLSKPFYYPGEEVKGVILVIALRDIEVYGLDLKFIIIEDWQYKPNKTKYKVQNDKTLVKLSIDIEDKLIILGDIHILPKGSYKFPFNYKIPEFLNSSFKIRKRFSW